MVGSPTQIATINSLLTALLSGQQQVLGDTFVGLYLGGSLAAGDFAPLRSDIDFLAVTTDAVPDATLPALEAMHARITETGGEWAKRMEGPYIPLDALRRYDPANATHPTLGTGGHFHMCRYVSDWIIQRHVFREHGIALAGPPLRTLIDPVMPDDLRRASVGILAEWWLPQLDDPFRLFDREYQAYATLTMCRVLYTIEQGTVAAKSTAARWAKKALGDGRAGLIDRALAWPSGPQPDELAETLEFVRFAIERSRRA